MFLVTEKLTKNKVISFVVAIGAMYVLKPYIAARAQLVTFILFIWTVYFIEKFLDDSLELKMPDKSFKYTLKDLKDVKIKYQTQEINMQTKIK